jgi:hypothetical protein
MIGAPLTGWAMVSTDAAASRRCSTARSPGRTCRCPTALNERSRRTHELLAWIGLSLIVLHVAGALQAPFLLKDGLLRRMGPAARPGPPACSRCWWWRLLRHRDADLELGRGNGGYAAEPASRRGHAGPSTARRPPRNRLDTATPTDTPTPTDEATEAGPPPTWRSSPAAASAFSVGSGDGRTAARSPTGAGDQVRPRPPETADIRIDVKLASASLGDATQDEMLRAATSSPARQPDRDLALDSVRQTGANRYSASGTLSLKGASKPQSLTFTLSGEGLRRHVEGSASIDSHRVRSWGRASRAGSGESVSLQPSRSTRQGGAVEYRRGDLDEAPTRRRTLRRYRCRYSPVRRVVLSRALGSRTSRAP